MSHRTGRTMSAGFIRTKPAGCMDCGKKGVSRRGWNCRYCGEIYVSREGYEAARLTVQLGDDGKVRFAKATGEGAA